MVEVLAAIGSGTTAVLVPLVAWLVYSLVRSKNEQLAGRDLLDTTREELAKVRGELDVETAAHAVTTDELKDEKKLRVETEAQRNDAWRQAREHYADFIANSGIGDAVVLGNRLLAQPLPKLRVTNDTDLEKPT